MSAGPELRIATALERLGPEWDGLFGAGAGPQTSREWFAANVAGALPAGAAPYFIGAVDAQGPSVLFPMLRLSGREWQSLTTPYTCLWQPLVRPGLAAGDLADAACTIGAEFRSLGVARLEAVDPCWPGLPLLLEGFRRAGLACRRYDHFANWFASVASGWDAYLQARPGALRETIRRKSRVLQKDADVRIAIASSPAEIARSLAAYEDVYARSWKDPEPFPRFNALLIDRLAPTGSLRMFVMWSGDRPVAAQYWTVAGRFATVLKLAHDEQEKRLSPGTVLTAMAIRQLIETDGIAELDFGRGDDPYKRAWTDGRRQRIGVLALNRLTTKGLKTAARHDVGRAIRRIKGRIARDF